ncbi:hypothetical protein AYJ54_25090 [Bradyrhizobium centrolobii]|uniref:Uncharacterized protein n=1 Tax=Bradyrhizobium centrolobii TaxID=1505087 RepID=A0A176YDE9_9BRAD|nr:hypothetical protein [Bradyrhizobium centrolobii]OAF02888.1 hypothetical protein AYJ54_25090 [Bradyrhizobium centrolobii]
MPDADMTALLRMVLDDVCADVPASETAIRQRVAARLREAARRKDCSLADLKQAGRDALSHAPTMWP